MHGVVVGLHQLWHVYRLRGWHMYRGLERTGSRMPTPQRLTIFYPHLFPLCMTEQIHVAATTITKPCMHAYIRYHDVSTRALILINFLLVWKWKIKRNRTWSLRRVWFRMQAWSMIDLQIRRPNCLPVSYRGSAFWFSHWAHGSMRCKGLLHE